MWPAGLVGASASSDFAAYGSSFGAPADEWAAQGVVSTLLSYALPSPLVVVWLLTGFVVGVAVGCFGATALRPCGALHAIPVLLATVALYALTPSI